MKKTLSCTFAILLFVCAAVAQPGSSFALRPGDRVVFYGDSITDQRLYSVFIQDYVITRFPELHVTFHHSGVGGDRVSGGGSGPIDVRLSRDVIAFKPTVVTIMLGMNDGEYAPLTEERFERYTSGYTQIVKRLKTELPGVRITVIGPSPYDEFTREVKIEGGYNQVLQKFSAFLVELSQKEGLTYADANAPFVSALLKAKTLEPELSRAILPDRVHPSPAGALLVTAAVLRSWNAPAIVSSVEIDGAAARVNHAEETRVSDLAKTAQGLVWRQEDRHLPLPIFGMLQDPTAQLILRSSDMVQSIDQQPLRVTGLATGRYLLKIDDQKFGPFSDAELAAGLNLALMETPMHWQAMMVQWTADSDALLQTARRMLQASKHSPPHLTEAIAAIDNEDTVSQQAQLEFSKPQPRSYELIKQD